MTDDQVSNGTFAFAKLADADDAVMIRTTTETLTGNDVSRKARSIVSAAKVNGVKPGDICILSLRKPLNTVLAIFALWHLGATPLVLDVRVPLQERRAIQENSGARHLIVDRLRAEDGATTTILFDEGWFERTPEASPPSESDAARKAPLAVLMSSGTTGLNKLFTVPRDRFLGSRDWRYSIIPYPRGLTMVAITLQFVGSFGLAMGSLLNGQPVYLHPPLSSTEELANAIIDNQVTEVSLAPPTIRSLIAYAGDVKEPLFPTVKLLRVTGGPLAPEDKLLAYNRLSNHFSASFGSGTTGVVSVLYGQDMLDRPETAGRILDGIRVETVSEDGAVLPQGTPGLMRVYSNRTGVVVPLDMSHGNETIGEDWAMPGDICVVDDQGFLTILGRTSDMIVRGGVNVNAADVEAVLLRHPQVAEAAAVAVPDAHYGFEVGAVVVGQGIELESVRRHCAKHISPEKRPHLFAVAKSLPYNPSGKIQRRKIDLSIFETG